jgi:hypothetical protein
LFDYFLTLSANQIIMAKEKLTKKSICQYTADRIHKGNLSFKEIEGALLSIWSAAYTEGYLRRMDEQKKFKAAKEKTLKEDFDKIRDAIEDEIHDGTKLQKHE